jgi:hypothetical protein
LAKQLFSIDLGIPPFLELQEYSILYTARQSYEVEDSPAAKKTTNSQSPWSTNGTTRHQASYMFHFQTGNSPQCLNPRCYLYSKIYSKTRHACSHQDPHGDDIHSYPRRVMEAGGARRPNTAKTDAECHFRCTNSTTSGHYSQFMPGPNLKWNGQLAPARTCGRESERTKRQY